MKHNRFRRFVQLEEDRIYLVAQTKKIEGEHLRKDRQNVREERERQRRREKVLAFCAFVIALHNNQL